MKTDIIAMLAMANTVAGFVVPSGTPSDQLCKGTSFNEQGNRYCVEVGQIAYLNVGGAGQYQEVVDMDQDTGDCKFAPRQFSGPLAPFNEPVRPGSGQP